MIKLESIKSKIIASMVGLSLITAITIGSISVIRSSQIISNSAKEMLVISSKNISNEIYNDLKQVEKNVNLMGSFVQSTSSIQHQSDMNKLRNFSAAEAEYSKIRIYAKKMGENTKWCMSSYFFYDQNYIPNYDGAWFVGKDGNLERKILNTEITKEDGGYYWAPVELGKGLWAAPYIDSDLKIAMITYSTPVYKNGFLLGLAGMDITLDNLNKTVKNINIYKNTNAFIVDNKFTFIAGNKFNVGDNILTANNGLYKFLESILKKQKSGFIEYKDKGTSKIITYSTLSNGFILLIDVPLSEVLSEMNNMIFLLVLLTVIGLVITSVIAIKIGKKISKPIEDLAQMSLMLANNDLTVNIDEDKSSKEMVNLSSSFKKFTEQLRGLIKQISESAVNVASSSNGMNAASEQTANVAQHVAIIANQLATGSQQQADGINDCLSNINNMSSSIRKISDNTKDVVSLAKESENNAGNGHNLAEKAVNKIKLIKDTTIETSQVTNKLNNLASEIGTIVDLIKNIANQTNLLALNAAIEAARAGEHGKGFAVVADEVKKLAGQSAEATEKITNMINEIQSEAKNVSNAMVNSTTMVEEGVVIVENVGTNLEEILNATKKVSDNAEEVSKLINDAVSNSDNILKIMENISAIVEESTASTEEMAGSTQEQTASLEEISASSNSLAQTAEHLKALVSVFRV